MLPLQFLVDAVQALDAAFHGRGNARLFQLVAEYRLHPRQESFARLAPRFDRIVYLLVSDGIDVAEAQVFQFAADLAHAQAVGDGGVDLERLAGDFLLPLRRQMLQRAHVVQAVGQLDEHHADVIHHGQHHLAQVLGLLLFAGGEIDGADLGDALDDVRHLLAEFLADIDDRHRGIFHGVMQQPGGDGDRVHLHLGQNQRHFQGMDQVGLAGGAALSGMVFLGKLVGFADEFEIVVGPVGPHSAHQLAEPGHREHIGRELLAQRRHAWIIACGRVARAPCSPAALDVELSAVKVKSRGRGRPRHTNTCTIC